MMNKFSFKNTTFIKRATVLVTVFLLLSFLFYSFIFTSESKYAFRFSNFTQFLPWLRTQGYKAKIIQKLPDHTRSIYQARAGLLLEVNNKDCVLCVFLE